MTALLTLCFFMLLAAIVLIWNEAPYGKFSESASWLPLTNIKLDGRIGFMVMELPSMLCPVLVFAYFWTELNTDAWVFFFLFELHYVHRTLVYPLFRMPKTSKTTLATVVMAFFFTLMNGYFMPKFVIFETYSGCLCDTFLKVTGIAVFLAGFVINFWADHVLVNLRPPGDKGYYIPKGYLYNYISCPNYFGEVLEWVGILIAFRTYAALGFAINTGFNLIPRGVSTHRWYNQKFKGEYPKERRAVIPFLL